MSEQHADRDDPIHRVFRRLREGFSDIVVNLVDRVDGQLQLYIEDERQLSPELDVVLGQAMGDLAGVFSGLITQPESSHPADTSDDSDGEEPS